MFEIYIRVLHAYINDVANNTEIINQLKLIANNTELNFNLLIGNKTFSITEIIDLLERSNFIHNNEIERELFLLFSEVERYYNLFGKQYFIN